ncbi:MAG: PAS domain-containing sensor histidine kinase [Clostridium argentinense]|uniref:histidine kinase n=1 Tax=Clostridium faecium TaxID=2762223 RepID=A0ABR8YUB2_9CLOT|nr:MULTISPECIES: PAS domain-containing sensor histidine kinase [Clostridium]MBD8047727.1 PAS domain-containing sensor histidine kinase [Clostridium faecium]MBS5823809.1 PAS domain-containing sensor histidine kinase [Clostridium argentinense]MDU1348071.1 PAS domain-containing sensor histidine kinase [Clostridium argentinense]
MVLTESKDIKLFEFLSDAILVLGENDKLLYCNTTASNLMGYNSFIDIENKLLYEVMTIDSNDEVVINYDALIKSNILNKVTKKITFKSGDEGIFNLRINNVKYNQENAFIIIMQKISSIEEEQYNSRKYIDSINKKIKDDEKLKNKEVEKANNLINSCDLINNSIMRKILVYSPNIIIIRKNEEIIFANKEAQYFLNVDNEEEIIGQKFYDLITFDSTLRLDYKSIFSELNHSKSQLPLSQVKLKTYNGKEVYGDIFSMSFFENNEEFSVLIAKDISKRVHMEEKLIKNEEYYKRLLEFLPYGVAILNNGKINFVNEALVNMLREKSMNNIINSNASRYIPDEYKHIMYEMGEHVFNELKQIEFRQLSLMRADGTEVEVEVGAAPFIFEDSLSAIIVIYDVTERKNAQRDKYKLEQALKYDRLKTEFIANVSHELKTPLNIILSVVQLLQHKHMENGLVGEEETTKRYLSVMKQNCYRLLRLINNLIDITRIEVGYLKMGFGNYDIVKVVEDITMSTVDYIESKGLSLIFDTDVEEKIIGIDRENMERVMLNLLSNAIKFSKENGHIWVNIYDKGDTVEISVKDDGIGISEEMQESIFERFVQSDPLFTRNHEGSGIGLSLVKSIVEAHGGQVYAKSKEGYGSEFIVELPNILSKKQPKIIEENCNQDYNVEKIQIEFSDIYS